MITGTASNGLISRNPSWFDPSQDFTKSFYYKTSRTPLVNVTAWLFGPDLAYTTPYIWFGTGLTSDDVYIEYDTGSGATQTAHITVAHDVNVYVSIRYTRATHLLELLFDGVVQASVAANFDSFVAQDSEAMLNEGSSDDSTVSIAYERFHQAALTNAQIITEKNSINAVITTNLLSDCLLQASIDLTDHNDNLRQFSATGTVETNTNDPLLNIVAGPPTNIDPNTATEITANSAVFQDTLTTGAATTVWYKYVAESTDKVIGLCGFGDLVTYTPIVTVYPSLADALANTSIIINGAIDRPCQFPVDFGNTYYFKFLRNGAVTPATIQVSLLKCLQLPVPVGSIGIPDDSSPFSLAFLDINSGYPINFHNGFPNGEQGIIFPTGEIVAGDSANNTSYLFDSQLNLRASPTFPSSGFTQIGASLTYAYIAKNVGGIINRIDKLGNLDATQYDTPGNLKGLSANSDDTIIYYITTGVSTNIPVKRWDIVNNIALTDLVAGVVNYNMFQNVIVLGNDTIVANYNRSGVDYFARVYNPDGTTVSTATFSDGRSPDYLAIDISSNFYWLWSQDASTSRFRKIKASDGSVIVDLNDVMLFESGIYQGAITNTPVRFGHSNSCPLWITRVALFPIINDASGLYVLTGTGNIPSSNNPVLTHDNIWVDASVGTTTNVAIPDPFFESYLAGDE